MASPDDFALYRITWSASSKTPSRDADDWVSTSNLPIGIPYSYTLHLPSCVKDRLPVVAGEGKGMLKLTCP